MLLDALQARTLFADALDRGYAVLAVNADSPAAVTDCLEAARLCDAPVAIETSLWQLTGRSFGAGEALTGMARYLAGLAVLAESARYRGVPVVFHIDHIKGPETLAVLIGAIRGLPFRAGGGRLIVRPSTISLDSSELSEEENLSTVAALCSEARRMGVPVSLEMEAGVDQGLTPPEVTERLLGGIERDHPGQVILWAPGLGTRHGLGDSDYPEFSAENVAAQRDLARKITGRGIGIALHGSSGLSEEALGGGVSAGIVKVNWSSESLLIRSGAAAEYYERSRERLSKSHPDFKASAMDNGVQSHVCAAYLPRVVSRIKALKGAGHGTRIVEAIRKTGGF